MEQNAENTLKTIADNYRQFVSERPERELVMIDEAKATGNSIAIQNHKALAEVYRSVLERQQIVQTA